MPDTFAEDYLQNARLEFRKLKALAEKAVAQSSDEELFTRLDEEANSIAIVMKHMAGNMRSRWTDFLTSDGEKPDRNRDGEFEIEEGATRTSLMASWEAGWDCLFKGIETLSAGDLGKKVLIRGEAHSVTQAINRQLTHYACHVGQIVFLAKHFRSREWKSLSIPRGKSAEFNAAMAARHKRGGGR